MKQAHESGADHSPIVRGNVETVEKRGPRLGSGAPKGRVPVTRPRRDRIMGSSILASLSEAGGNDPYPPMTGPFLPIHQMGGSCRNATHTVPYANGWPIQSARRAFNRPLFLCT